MSGLRRQGWVVYFELCQQLSELSQIRCGNIIHFDARPEGLRRPVVPGINNTCSHMLALRGYFIAVGCLLDADGKFLVRPARIQL